MYNEAIKHTSTHMLLYTHTHTHTHMHTHTYTLPLLLPPPPPPPPHAHTLQKGQHKEQPGEETESETALNLPPLPRQLSTVVHHFTQLHGERLTEMREGERREGERREGGDKRLYMFTLVVTCTGYLHVIAIFTCVHVSISKYNVHEHSTVLTLP